MRVKSYTCSLFVLLLLVTAPQLSYAQPGFQVDIKKEKPYEERKLKAEKTGEGQLKTPKRLFQNLTTRYNYYFNANNKLNEVLERAKLQHKDDFAQLLPFYNYSLDATAADSVQLDSVIYKCRTGIVNHDLRNEWIDELYLLWATSWHLQKKLDSASMMLQFINYAYAPQEEYGFYTYIGTRKEGAKELSIATIEDKKFLHSNTFSRNNAFIWQIKTRVEMGDLTSSGSLITTLKRDPAFPKRLTNELEEAEAYWYYKQGRWDSAAKYLIEAIDGAENKREKARWEYLIAQLLERSGRTDEAATYYTKAIATTPDPILEVYGRLNLVRINKDGGENSIDKNVAELLKMAKRDKYEEYRDIIYYMAAQMEMQRNNISAAQELLLKGAKYNNGNQSSRNKAFLQIADVSYNQKKYIQAAAFYDSVQVNDLSEAEAQRIFQRKPGLQTVVENSGIISRQDSLQRIAALPQEERDDFVKKLVKQLRKQQGLKDESAPTAGSQFSGAQPTELFSGSSKGEWYFYNANSRTQGAAEFKQVWGNRPNADNWRRFAVVSQQLLNRNVMNTRDGKTPNIPADMTSTTDLTFDGLSAKLPLTPEAQKASNDSIKNALFNLGTAYLNEMEDYPSAIETFEELRKRFPNADRMDEVLFNLYYSYTKAGNTAQAAQIKKLLQDKYPSTRFAAIATTGKDPQATNANSSEATKAYENVYNLFIEGRFEEAIAAKKVADSTYQTTFWQPQLLYIEAVYHIKQREDSVAKRSLQQIINQNTNPPLTDKAQTLLNVLNRRNQIEAELAAYQMQNQPAAVDTTLTQVNDATVNRPVITAQQSQATPNVTTVKPTIQNPKADTLVKKPMPTLVDTIAKKQVVKSDSIVKKPVAKPIDSLVKKPTVQKPSADTTVKKNIPPKSKSIYTHTPDAPHFAVVIMDKVDPVFVNEAKNAFHRFNRDRYYNQPLETQIISLTNDIKLLLVSGFPSAQAAVDYAQRTKALAPSEIIPWLTGNKYTFSIISAPNLEILKGTTEVPVYKKFLEQHLPGMF
jgi:tetratricopeptide (TPR) repeat protein